MILLAAFFKANLQLQGQHCKARALPTCSSGPAPTCSSSVPAGGPLQFLPKPASVTFITNSLQTLTEHVSLDIHGVCETSLPKKLVLVASGDEGGLAGGDVHGV